MREKYSLESICNYLKIDINKRVNADEAWDNIIKIKNKFDVVFNNEYGYCIMNPEIAIYLDGEEDEKHPFFMWIENWELNNDYELIGFEFNNHYDRNKKIK